MKLHSLPLLSDISRELRAHGDRIVLAHGCWDVPHIGHIKHLRAASNMGDVLIVTVTADAHVNKGPGRPIFPQQLRAEAIAGFQFVSYVAINDSWNASAAIEMIRPHVYVKGPECLGGVHPGFVEERRTAERLGCDVRFTEDVIFSSSEIARRVMRT